MKAFVNVLICFCKGNVAIYDWHNFVDIYECSERILSNCILCLSFGELCFILSLTIIH